MVVATYVALAYSVKDAFKKVYLPILFLLPPTFYISISGFPNTNFSDAALIPVMLGCLYILFYKSNWDFTLTTYAIFLYVVWSFFSELRASDLGLSINLLASDIITIVAPYFFGKYLIEENKNKAPNFKVASWLVFLIFLSLVSFPYQLIFIENIYHRIFDSLFPGLWHAAGPVRYGISRFNGPYVHPILAGLAIVIGFFFNIFVKKYRAERKNINAFVYKNKAVVTWCLVLASILTLSRGPYLGFFFGLLVFYIIRFRNQLAVMFFLLFLFITFGFLSYSLIKIYIALGPVSELQTSVSYRWELMWEFYPVILQEKIFGWGFLNWPSVGGYYSIDNNYIYVALKRGLVGLFIYSSIFLITTYKLFRFAITARKKAYGCSDFASILLAIMIAVIVTAATVWIDSMLSQVVFIIIGWSEAFLYKQKKFMPKAKKTEVEDFFQDTSFA